MAQPLDPEQSVNSDNDASHLYDSDSEATDGSPSSASVADAGAGDREEGTELEVIRLAALHQAVIQRADSEQREKANDPAQETVAKQLVAMDKAREYQQELFERAKEENIIAVLDTGMGKTLIAAMLIRHVLDQDTLFKEEDGPRKQVFFLANNVPLVHQQARYLTKHLPVFVQALTGDDGVDKWNRDEWTRILGLGNVIVCTPAVLDQALFHNFVRMSSTSLIVFDEAHHCKKRHPYAEIVKNYYLKTAAGNDRPRLFGMTASPVDSKRSVDQTIADLEELLQSKVVTITDAALIDFAYKPVDVTWEYGHLDYQSPTPLWEALNQFSSPMPFLKPDLRDSLKMSSHLGTWFSDKILRHVFGAHEDVRTLYGKFERSSEYAQMTEEEREDLRAKLFAAPGWIAQQAIFTLKPEYPCMSSKVQLLYTKLNELFSVNESARAMVFVEERWTAVVLCDAFKTLNVPHLHPGYLTGGGSSGSEVVSARRQEETIRKFIAGAVNILFTTSVGEEGIDIPQCNIVVRFDANHTTIQYIQGRGRARRKASIYAHMIEAHNLKHKEDVRFCIEDAQYIKDYCQQLPSDRLLGKGTKLAQILAKESSYPSFETSSGVRCSFNNCLVILSRYANSLHHIGAVTSESYEEVIQEASNVVTFQYIVRLPAVGESIVKGAKGNAHSNKILARRSAAFECIVKLRIAGLLDDNLDSKFKRFRRIERRMAVSEKKHPYEMITKPKLWADTVGLAPAELYATTVDLKPKATLTDALIPLVLLTRTPLPEFPSFPIYLQQDVQVDVISTSIGKYQVNEVDLKALTEYTLNAVFEDVFNKIYKRDPSTVSYWVVPRNCSDPGCTRTLQDVVDFERLQASGQERIKWKPGSDASKWLDVWIVDHWSGKTRYIVNKVVKGVSVHDPEPKAFLPAQGDKRHRANITETVATFTDNEFGKFAVRAERAKRCDPSQPVLEAIEQSLRRNVLDRPTEQEQKRITRWIAPQTLQVGRLSAAEARSVLTLPSIIHRLEAYLIVLEGLQSIGLAGISAELALEAHTKDGNTDDQEARTHATKFRGMGKNYERLEFIGDSLLKMTSTISVYNRSTGKEGDMHDRRKHVLCNDTLCNVSKEKTHMYRYIRSSGFDRYTWYPEHMIQLGGRGALGNKTGPKEMGKKYKAVQRNTSENANEKQERKPVKHDQRMHDLGFKTIADVSEATIGAAIMACKHFPVETRFDLGIQAITTLTDSDDHRLSCWADFATQHTFQDWQLRRDDPLAAQVAASVERKIGYKFQYPRLARSAFTHPSEMNSPVPDYQRLEFLGDACFDWVAIWWLFSTNPTRNPEWLTEHKMAMVSNQFLAALAVLLDFDKLLFITNVKMKAAVSDYATECRAHRIEEGPNKPDFWRRLKNPPPKALADLVEATLGAILVDSNFSYAPIEQFFTTHVQPFFRDIELYDGYANKHPTSLIYKVINGEYGCRHFNLSITARDGGKLDVEDGEEHTMLSEGTEITAVVQVHRTVVAFADGTSAKYAKVRASGKALRVLEGLPRAAFREKFGCFCGEVAEE